MSRTARTSRSSATDTFAVRLDAAGKVLQATAIVVAGLWAAHAWWQTTEPMLATDIDLFSGDAEELSLCIA